MSRRTWLAVTAATTALLAIPGVARAANTTRWTIEPSEAHDALEAITYVDAPDGTGSVTKDVALRAIVSRIPPDAVRRVVDRFGSIFLDLAEPLFEAFDYARPRTLVDLRAAVRTAAPHAPTWFAQSAGDLERIVDGLINGGFSAYWHENNLPRAAAGAERLRAAFAASDPVAAATAILGTPAGDDVTLLVMGYAARGWHRLPGRRFYVGPDAKPAPLLQVVVDSLISDGYPLRDDAEVNRAVDALGDDRFVAGTLKARNSHGEYFRDLRSYVHGCCVAALQLLADGPPERMFWQRSGGIYVFAHVLYEVLAQERYASSAHGPFRATLLRLIGPNGPLAPGKVGPTYARLIGTPPAPPWPGAPPLPDPAG